MAPRSAAKSDAPSSFGDNDLAVDDRADDRQMRRGLDQCSVPDRRVIAAISPKQYPRIDP